MARISDLLYYNKVVFNKRYRAQDVLSLKRYANSRQGLQLSEDGLSFVRLIRSSKSLAWSVLPAFGLRSPTPYWSNLRLESHLKRFRLEFFIWWDLQRNTFVPRSFNPDFFFFVVEVLNLIFFLKGLCSDTSIWRDSCFTSSSAGNLRFRLRCILWLKRLQLETSVCRDLRQSTFVSRGFNPNFFFFSVYAFVYSSFGGLFTRYPFNRASYLRFSSGDSTIAWSLMNICFHLSLLLIGLYACWLLLYVRCSVSISSNQHLLTQFHGEIVIFKDINPICIDL